MVTENSAVLLTLLDIEDVEVDNCCSKSERKGAGIIGLGLAEISEVKRDSRIPLAGKPDRDCA
jgi:hypothetical protein